MQQQVSQIKGATATTTTTAPASSATTTVTAVAAVTATIDRQCEAGAIQTEVSDRGLQEGKEEKEEPYVSYVRSPTLWPDCHSALSESQWESLLGGTAERLYGPFE